MRMKISNWLRTARFNLASLIMDKRDQETIIECGEILRTIVNKVGWKFINDIRRDDTIVQIEEEQIRFH